MRLYTELAHWWPLLSPPPEYVGEADDLLSVVESELGETARTMLELGCGGGSMAFHLKRRLRLTLTDISPQMLEMSRSVNPECEHVRGDMRSLRLERLFDVVMIHDAIIYLADRQDVVAALRTAWTHCRRDGLVVVLPDYTRENFSPGTDDGGEDGADGRALRYLEWRWDPDPDDHRYEVAYAFLLREADGTIAVETDRYVCGLFSREEWLGFFNEAGLKARARRDPWDREIFVARRPSGT